MTDLTPQDKTPQIFVYHDLHPEDNAMLQALYSRSPASVTSHLDKVKAAGSGKFMSQFYVGYGHASIGDCGVTTIFIENYSMFAAKAIQDHPLYSGQEASTRYLDFAQQPMIDPYEHPVSRAILDGWLALYNEYIVKLQSALKLRHPFNAEQYSSEKVWENAIKARSFDIMRGFLPCGATTLFSWTTNLRQAREKLMQLKQHPLPEVREMAKDVFRKLKANYPNSYNGDEMQYGGRYAERDEYAKAEALRDHFIDRTDVVKRGRLNDAQVEKLRNGGILVDRNGLDLEALRTFENDALYRRPVGAAVSKRLGQYGCYNLYFVLDFGSFRDLQRHRNGLCQIPVVDGWAGIYPWYMEQVQILLSDEFKVFEEKVSGLLGQIENLSLKGIAADKLKNQYLYPMGMGILCHLAYTVPQMVYVAELRSMKTVHPTLRPIAQEMGKILQEDVSGIKLYVDYDRDDWSVKRGSQTIEAKAA